MLFTAAISALSLVSAAVAQTVIQVGAEASSPGGIFQFMPPSITAKNGTVISFQFTGVPGNHSVTQSTFADPCDPAAGGFDSGWVEILNTGLSSVPQWNLTITDDSKPIWFFCKQLLPQFHCPSGMVGAINAPTTGNTFAAFQKAAQSFATTPGQLEGNLVGNGASASAGVADIPSGATGFTAAPLTAAASGSASGSAPAASVTAPPAGSSAAAGGGSSAAAPTTTAAASGAYSIAASMLSVVVAAIAGISLL